MTAPLPRTPRPTSRPVRARRHGLVPPVLVVTAGLLLGACTTGTPQATDDPTRSASPATASPTAAGTTPTSTTTATPAPATSPTPEASGGAAPAPADGAPGQPATTVDVVVTFSGWNTTTSAAEVGAYAATLTPGTCTLRLTGPRGASAEVSVPTVADASTVSCDGLSVPRARLSSGTWSGTVEYVGSNASGRGDVPPMDIP
ncbi:hypothetical protein [Cellulomonas phragmiteti]|uniref:CBM2 domain-containing protein n=1 Tax=Cellulomonas phragmiteti TaxID=478780 RepID=A0ABQ4DJS8_9CELL|nr:hypothetical protein [Cellulomonas phragmiteti]GIG39608.1 hypothetical protein Cph01nite_13700 [Cellulomonas phragmiteti]